MATSLPFLLFSKHVLGPRPAELAAEMQGHGITGLDLSVRRGGHVEPQDALLALPDMVGQLAQEGIVVGMLTTAITDIADPHALPVLETAARLGIRYYKLGYWRYAGFGNLRRQRAEVAERLRDISQANYQLGLTAGFHNHSHDFIGASLWDVDAVLSDIPPQLIGAYLDPAHATIEGGSSGWRLGMDLLGSRINMLAVKDFRWVEGKHRYAGGRRHSAEFCPLAVGNTPWREVLQHLSQLGFSGPVSFHGEYQGPHSFAELSWRDVVAQTSRDVAAFRSWLPADDTDRPATEPPAQPA